MSISASPGLSFRRAAVAALTTIAVMLMAPTPLSAAAEPYRAIGRFEAPPGGGERRRLATPEEQAAYDAAIRDARRAEPAEVASDLAALTTDSLDLAWWFDGVTTRVLLVTWTGWDGYLGQEGRDMTLGVDVWTSPYPQMRDFAAGFDAPTSAALDMRLRQLIGLPPDDVNPYVVEMWVDPADVFRPSPDPEITDRQASLEFPRSEDFVAVTAAHRDWIESLEAISYEPGGYPWTRLGYTYDWNPESSEVGVAEYVVRQGATVRVKSVMTTAEYAAQPERRIRRLLEDFAPYAEQARRDWLAPAMAIAVVYRDEVVFLETFGSRDAEGEEPLDVDALFPLGSTSKAFTSALAAQVVGEGLLDWEDPVAETVADFQLPDPGADSLCVLRDLMAQHPGVAPQAVTALGLFDYGPGVINRAYGYLEGTGGFRRDFSYQNGLFVTAASMIEAATGSPWDAALSERILAPLGIDGALTSLEAFADAPDRVDVFRYVGDHPALGIEELRPDDTPFFSFVDAFAPAGAVCASITHVSRYLRMQLAGGLLDGVEIVGAEALAETHAPQTPITSSLDDMPRSYCMGWVLEGRADGPILFHNGDTGLSKSAIGMSPRDELGVAVLTNVGRSGLPDALVQQFFDLYRGRNEADRSRELLDAELSAPLPEEPVRPDPPEAPRDLDLYAGTYVHPLLGEALVQVSSNTLTLTAGPEGLTLPLSPWSGDHFWFGPAVRLFDLDEEDGGVVFSEFPGDGEPADTMEIGLLSAFGPWSRRPEAAAGPGQWRRY